MLCYIDPLLFRYLPLVFGHVYFIADQHLFYICISVDFYLLNPVGELLEAFSVRAVIDQKDAVGCLVVAVSQCSEPLLACSVKYLYFDLLVEELDHLKLLGHAHSEQVLLLEGVVVVPLY